LKKKRLKLLFLPRDIIVSQGEKDLTYSLGQLKLVLTKDMIGPLGKRATSSGKGQNYSRKHIFEIFPHNHLMFIFL
jgi:hypothetical protein